MTRKQWLVLFVVIFIIIFPSLLQIFGAKSLGKPPALSLSKPVMARSVDNQTAEPKEPAETFTTDTPLIYCSTKLTNAPSDTEVTTRWMYVDGEAAELKGSLLNETSGKFSGTRYLSFSLTYDPAWPRGSYSVTVLLNKTEKYTVQFTVE